jgi:hypothetical protein
MIAQHPTVVVAAALVGFALGGVAFWLLLKVRPVRAALDHVSKWLGVQLLKAWIAGEVHEDGWQRCAPCSGIGAVRRGLAWPRCEACRGTGRVERKVVVATP